MKWVDTLTDELPDGDGVHVDGKCLRRAFGNDGRQPCIVSAYSSKDRIVIGQVKADEKSNEITAIPDLLRRLYLTGAIVTIDAAGCQKKIVSGSASRSVSVSSSQPSAASKRGLKRPLTLAADCWPLVAETLGRRPTFARRGCDEVTDGPVRFAEWSSNQQSAISSQQMRIEASSDTGR